MKLGNTVILMLKLVLLVSCEVALIGCAYSEKPRPEAYYALAEAGAYEWEVEVIADATAWGSVYGPSIGRTKSTQHYWIYTDRIDGAISVKTVAVSWYRGGTKFPKKMEDLSGEIVFDHDVMVVNATGPVYDRTGNITRRIELPINGRYKLSPA